MPGTEPLFSIEIPKVRVEAFAAGAHFTLSSPEVQAGFLNGAMRYEASGSHIEPEKIASHIMDRDLPVLRKMLATMLAACVKEMDNRKRKAVTA